MTSRALIHKVSLLAVAAALYGCSSTQPPSKSSWRVEPVLKVSHATATAEGYYELGRYSDGMRAWDKSVQAYRKALALDPGHVDARNALAVALARRGRLDEAETELRLALAASPQRADLHSNLGYLLLLARRPTQALPALQAAVQLDPRDTVAQTNLKLAQEQAPASSPQPAAVVAAAAPAPGAQAQVVQEAQVQMAPVQAAQVHEVQAQGAPAQEVAAREARPHEASQGVPQPTPAAAAAMAAPAAQPAQAALAPPAQPAVAVGPFELEVSNGLGRTGAAGQLRQQLQFQGLRVRHLSNSLPYGQPYTVVLYRPGQADAARHVARMLPISVPLMIESTQRTDVRVLLGHDWPQAVTTASAAAAPRD